MRRFVKVEATDGTTVELSGEQIEMSEAYLKLRQDGYFTVFNEQIATTYFIATITTNCDFTKLFTDRFQVNKAVFMQA